MAVHWSLNFNKYPQVSRTILNILKQRHKDQLRRNKNRQDAAKWQIYVM